MDCSQIMLLLMLACACVCAHGAPVKPLTAGSCLDAAAYGAAGQALDQINLDRTDGYILSLDHLSNAHYRHHGETGVVYYLTIYVLETKCHVLSKKNWRNCEVRDIGENPVYGQCRAVIYMNKVHRVSRLYRYSCVIRPVPASRIIQVCPDCPILISVDNEKVVKAMKMGMESFNKNSMLANYFIPLNITRATSQGGFVTFYNVEFTIQETVCSNNTDIANASECKLMSCEFAHKGHCRSSLSYSHGNEHLRAECEIFESETSQEEQKRHLQGEELDHRHASISDMTLEHDHKGAHTHHAKDSSHHHTHEHKEGQGQAHDHGHHHDHGHDHAHGHDHGLAHAHGDDHDHAHAHHSEAHNHTQNEGSHTHHRYSHGEGETHAHDHEIALDHEHGHVHLHVHEHHHHHHEHQHESLPQRPEGAVYVVPSMDEAATLSVFPVPGPAQTSSGPIPSAPRTPGPGEPPIEPFPTSMSHQCPAGTATTSSLIKAVFAEDLFFKTAAA